MKKIIVLCALFAAAHYTDAALATLDSLNTGANNYYRPTTVGNHNWSDAGMTFHLDVVDDGWGGTTWGGLTYSDMNNTTGAGYTNQYAVYGSGRDVSGSGVYSIGYIDAWNGLNPTVSFDSAMTVNGFYLNNTTYTALDMLNGSGYSKQFTTNDFLTLSIMGYDASNNLTGTVSNYLANFTGYTEGQNRADYIVTNWTWVDLTPLSNNVRSIKFSLTSSDNGMFGMNTPAYFAIDQLQAIPEPASGLLLLLGGWGVFQLRRARSNHES